MQSERNGQTALGEDARAHPTKWFSSVAAVFAAVASLITLGFTYYENSVNRDHEDAMQVRMGAAEMCAKLERWKDLKSAILIQTQPEFLDLMDVLKRKDSDPVAVQHRFWRYMASRSTESSVKISDEKLETIPMALVSHQIALRAKIRQEFDDLRKISQEEESSFLSAVQEKIAEYKIPVISEQSATNALIGIQQRSRRNFIERASRIIDPVCDELHAVLMKSDSKLSVRR